MGGTKVSIPAWETVGRGGCTLKGEGSLVAHQKKIEGGDPGELGGRGARDRRSTGKEKGPPKKEAPFSGEGKVDKVSDERKKKPGPDAMSNPNRRVPSAQGGD